MELLYVILLYLCRESYMTRKWRSYRYYTITTVHYIHLSTASKKWPNLLLQIDNHYVRLWQNMNPQKKYVSLLYYIYTKNLIWPGTGEVTVTVLLPWLTTYISQQLPRNDRICFSKLIIIMVNCGKIWTPSVTKYFSFLYYIYVENLVWPGTGEVTVTVLLLWFTTYISTLCGWSPGRWPPLAVS